MTARRTLVALGTGAVVLAAGGLLGTGLSGGAASATGTASCGSGAPTLTVHGSGTASATPNQLTVSLSVDASAASAVGALGADDAAAAAVEASMRSGGVPARRIQTTGLSIQPDYSTQGGQVVLTGYSVDDTVVATVTALSRAGQLLDAVTSAGGNDTRIASVSFGMVDPRRLQDRARQDAVAQAVSHAAALAAAAGTRLAGVCSISDQGSPAPGPIGSPFSQAANGAVRAPTVPLQAGTEQAQAEVTVVYRLAPGTAR